MTSLCRASPWGAPPSPRTSSEPPFIWRHPHRILSPDRFSTWTGAQPQVSCSDLLAEAERAGFDNLPTAEKNIQCEQNLVGRIIAVVVLSTPQWPRVRLREQLA